MSEFRNRLHDERADPAPGTRRPDVPAGCFADEIAIDFPSMVPAVERIRDGLTAPEQPAISRRAQVSLSAREADAGVVVPLELVLRGTCRRCGGRGESWAERCDPCAGSGACETPHYFQLAIPAGVVDGARFEFLVGAPQALPTRVEVTVLVA